MSEQEQREQVNGRSVTVEAWGDSLINLELAALDVARDFFGAEMRLEVVPDYQARAYKHEPPERRYHANVTVRECLS